MRFHNIMNLWNNFVFSNMILLAAALCFRLILAQETPLQSACNKWEGTYVSDERSCIFRGEQELRWNEGFQYCSDEAAKVGLFGSLAVIHHESFYESITAGTIKENNIRFANDYWAGLHAVPPFYKQFAWHIALNTTCQPVVSTPVPLLALDDRELPYAHCMLIRNDGQWLMTSCRHKHKFFCSVTDVLPTFLQTSTWTRAGCFYTCLPGRENRTTNCNQKIKECASNPCENKAVCQEGDGYWACKCKPGFVGPRCSIELNECDSLPCQNGATCIDTQANFKCICADGYTGDYCETNVDECASIPCLHSATCTDLIDGYNCTCYAAFSGENCEIPLTSCDIQSSEKRATRVKAFFIFTICSIFCAAMLSLLMLGFLILRVFTVVRIYHFGQELSMFFSLLLVLFYRSNTVFDIGAFCDETAEADPPAHGDSQCFAAAVLLHYTYGVYFTFVMLEGLHNFTTFTFVFNGRPILSRLRILGIGFGAPAIVVGFSLLILNLWLGVEYTSESSCWVNTSSVIFGLQFFCNATCGLTAMVLSESGNLQIFTFPPHPKADFVQWSLSFANQQGVLLQGFFALLGWTIGALGVNLQDATLYAVWSFSNVLCTFVTIGFHSFGNKRSKRILLRSCCVCVYGKKEVERMIRHDSRPPEYIRPIFKHGPRYDAKRALAIRMRRREILKQLRIERGRREQEKQAVVQFVSFE